MQQRIRLGRPAADITADGRVIGLRTLDEALAFLADGSGYVTISEGGKPPIHWFVTS